MKTDDEIREILKARGFSIPAGANDFAPEVFTQIRHQLDLEAQHKTGDAEGTDGEGSSAD